MIVYNQFVLPYLLFFARESLAQAYATMVPHAHMKGRVGGALVQFSGTMKGVTLIPTPTHTFTHYNTFFLMIIRDSGNLIADKLAVEVQDASIQKGKAIVDLLVWKKIQQKFQLPDCYALLNRTYNEGAMMVEWLIPPSTSKALLTQYAQPWSATDFFQREHIVRVTLNDDSCVYDIRVQSCI